MPGNSIDKVLIANRGEIAVRIIRACREMGITSVVIYSDIDQAALAVRLADEAIPIGPALASQSYLNGPKIIQAALQSGAQAIHPGYGFLSEDGDFAQMVQDAGLIFIGPTPDTIRAMGDKAQARRMMQAAGVPVVPGYHDLDDEVSLLHAAGEIGYPVIIKAAAGGGGKGMRVIWEPRLLDEGMSAARREAAHAFNDDRLILEAYIPKARHIEFQILADERGKIVHLFERECSVQRRHQKIIEETPSPTLDEQLRQEMGTIAIHAAQTVNYTNAGTVEFIYDPDRGAFFFLEMNTRLQVEHPITELVTGLDLVQWQIRIAAGESLPFKQDQLSQRGHAIECRIYAEDPENNFLPATGPLLRFIEPGGPGIRVDSGFTSGDEISIHYDPLIAKIIACAEDRPSAVRKMQAALQDLVILGLPTNWRFLLDVLASKDFQAGQVYNTWIEKHFGDWKNPICDLPPEVLIAAALTIFSNETMRPDISAQLAQKDPFSPWNIANRFRTGE